MSASFPTRRSSVVQFDQVMSAVRSSPELVALGRDGKGEDRFTSRDMIAAEQRLERAAEGFQVYEQDGPAGQIKRSEEHTSEHQSIMRNSYAVFCLKKKNN